jgi:hypothetical protein
MIRRIVPSMAALACMLQPRITQAQAVVVMFDGGAMQTRASAVPNPKPIPVGGIDGSVQVAGFSDEHTGFAMSIVGETHASTTGMFAWDGGGRAAFVFGSALTIGAGVHYLSLQRPDTTIQDNAGGVTTYKLGTIKNIGMEGTAKISFGHQGRAYLQARYMDFSSGCTMTGSSLSGENNLEGKCYEVIGEFGYLFPHGFVMRLQGRDRTLRFPLENENLTGAFNEHAQFAALGIGFVL